jgi:hypothetical protein
VLKFETKTSRLTKLTAHRRLGYDQICLRGVNRSLFDGDLHLKRLRIELNHYVAFFYPVVVINQNLRDLSADARGDESDIAVHVSIVSRNGMPCVKNPGNDDEDEEQHTDNNEGAARSKFF